ncbi:quinon protein alcohol dehydrogenase-like superfamily [Mycena floridula]|nr:quinon protein alcohol dehydrogenase-like superfamily [Mycena floridula]
MFPNHEAAASFSRLNHPARREIMENLIEILLQQSGDSPSVQPPAFRKDDTDGLSVDESEHLQLVGAEIFKKFQIKLNVLDKELSAFSNAIRQLGSSAGVLSAAYNLREALARVLHLYRENAADLFPRKVARNTPEDIQRRKMMTTRTKIFASAVTNPTVEGKVNLDSDFPLNFPAQFKNLAQCITAFRFCLNEFPELTDDAVLLTVNSSISSFETDLAYWVSCLEEYRGQFHDPSVKNYLHELSSDLGVQVDNMTSTISMFIEVGVPAIHFAQRHGSSNLQNLSTVATFFSAVTATTLQFSYQLDHSGISVAVNCFWFASLVFSIAAAVNGLLGLTWKQAMYRSPNHRVPWWVLSWIKRCPLLFLVLSVACFSVGLCCFVYASHQHRVTSIVTTVLTSITCFGLAAVSAWLVSERWAFGRHQGSKWLSDVLVDKARSVHMWLKYTTAKTINSLSTKGKDHGKRREDLEGFSSAASPFQSIPRSSQSRVAVSATSTNIPTAARQLWSNAIRTVRMHSAVSSNLAFVVASSVRISALRPKLECLEPVQDMTVHQAMVRHLQFSSDGKFLATTSWDRTSIVLRVTPTGCKSHRILAYAPGFASQVEWSPSGNLLLAKLVRGIKLWTEDGVCQRTIDRWVDVESIAWLPDSQGFLSVEGSNVVKLDLHGEVLAQYHFGKMVLHDVAVTSDGVRLLGVGTLSESPNGLKPSKSRVEKRLVAFNTETGSIEHQTPVLNNVRNISLSHKSRKALVALVSYDNTAPPQLWKMDLVKDLKDAHDNNARTSSRLTLMRTYIPKAVVDFAGPSYFGGKRDQLVLYAGKAGDIHIWDQESGALLHQFNAPRPGRDLTSIAWNNASDDPFMFATGSLDGNVRIWSKPQDNLKQPGTAINISPTESLDSDNLDGEKSMFSPRRERAVAFALDT